MVHNYAPSLLSNIPALRDDATLAQQGMGVAGHDLERLRMGARGPPFRVPWPDPIFLSEIPEVVVRAGGYYIAEAATCGGAAGLVGHMVHGALRRSPLRNPERGRAAPQPMRQLLVQAPRAAVAAAAGVGAAEGVMLWVEGLLTDDEGVT